MDHLKDENIDEKYRGKVYIQDYSKKPTIEGVQVLKLNTIVGEDGDLSEVMRLKDGEIEAIPGFKLFQVNRVQLLAGAVKAWNLHYKQDDLWLPLPPGHLFVGLWDLRENSKTKGETMRISLMGGHNMLYIPKGVAHGTKNMGEHTLNLLYFVDQQFNLEDPDERRLPWDALGEDFWEPQRD